MSDFGRRSMGGAVFPSMRLLQRWTPVPKRAPAMAKDRLTRPAAGQAVPRSWPRPVGAAGKEGLASALFPHGGSNVDALARCSELQAWESSTGGRRLRQAERFLWYSLGTECENERIAAPWYDTSSGQGRRYEAPSTR